MQVQRTFVFRVYPTTDQQAILARWQGALRFIWNLAHEQRLRGFGRPHGDPKKFYSHADQCAELTDLRAEYDWIGDVPRDAQGALLDDLDTAWRDFFSGNKGKPSFKAKGRDILSLTAPNKKACYLKKVDGHDRLVFPKLGHLPIVLHRPLQGIRGPCTLKQDGDEWYAHITCKVEVDAVDATSVHLDDPTGIGIDLGVVNITADSSGNLTQNPAFGEQSADKIKKAQRNLARKKKGSKNRAKARAKLAKEQQHVRRQRDHFLNILAYHYAKNHRVIVVEDLRLKNMTRSAKGTVAEPGTNVAQKAGLNRSILDAGMGLFVQKLTAKMATFGHILIKVSPAHSSQECARCHHVDAANRRSQSDFVCAHCGHAENADVNAAQVIYSRRSGGGEVCGGDAVGRPMKQKPRSVRARTPRGKVAGSQSSGLQAGDGLLGRPRTLSSPTQTPAGGLAYASPARPRTTPNEGTTP